MNDTECIHTNLSRVQFIADVSLVAQCDLAEFRIAMSLIADLAHGTIPATEQQETIERSELLEYLKKRCDNAVL